MLTCAGQEEEVNSFEAGRDAYTNVKDQHQVMSRIDKQ
jgi:hypothetical protein